MRLCKNIHHVEFYIFFYEMHCYFRNLIVISRYLIIIMLLPNKHVCYPSCIILNRFLISIDVRTYHFALMLLRTLNTHNYKDLEVVRAVVMFSLRRFLYVNVGNTFCAGIAAHT